MSASRRPAPALILALAALLAATGLARAQPVQPAPGMAEHGAMSEAMGRMSRAMEAAPMTGDPDRDFVAMMIPHHQGAVDMARLYLRDGRDPQLRRMAARIVADQEREIREMRAWQARHPAPR